MISIKAKEQPRWFQIRWIISNWFVAIARWIYPQNPEVTAYYTQLMHDQLIYGKAVIRVNPLDNPSSEGE